LNDAVEFVLVSKLQSDEVLFLAIIVFCSVINFNDIADTLGEITSVHSFASRVASLNRFKVLLLDDADVRGDSGDSQKVVARDEEQVDAGLVGVLDNFLDVAT